MVALLSLKRENSKKCEKKNLFFYHLKSSEILWKNYEDIFYLFKKEEEEKAKGYEPFCSNRKEIEEEEDLISSCVHKRSRYK